MRSPGSAPAEGGAGMRWTDADGIHIDVRGLPAPEPLVAILELVGSIRDATAVIVHHDRDPQMLYPELAELGWSAEPIAGAPGEVRLRLVRAD
ncbi:MAG TPA: DUF2249 domain-containing protein [Burkholderiaceae bacterium]|nr:DUF2249 domain-containing protein [Burkholderiaceae bacterium]